MSLAARSFIKRQQLAPRRNPPDPKQAPHNASKSHGLYAMKGSRYAQRRRTSCFGTNIRTNASKSNVNPSSCQPNPVLPGAPIHRANERAARELQEAFVLKKVEMTISLRLRIMHRMLSWLARERKSATGFEIHTNHKLLAFCVKINSLNVPGLGDSEGCFEEFIRHQHRSPIRIGRDNE